MNIDTSHQKIRAEKFKVQYQSGRTRIVIMGYVNQVTVNSWQEACYHIKKTFVKEIHPKSKSP